MYTGWQRRHLNLDMSGERCHRHRAMPQTAMLTGHVERCHRQRCQTAMSGEQLERVDGSLTKERQVSLSLAADFARGVDGRRETAIRCCYPDCGETNPHHLLFCHCHHDMCGHHARFAEGDWHCVHCWDSYIDDGDAGALTALRDRQEVTIANLRTTARRRPRNVLVLSP